MLVGEFQHNIDSKGRLIVPARLRAELGERFYITKGLDKCLFVFPEAEWTKFEEKLSSLSLSQGRNIQRFFYGGMTLCEIDSHSRILIPQPLREYAGLDKDITIVGISKRAEIWNTQNWTEQNNAFIADSENVAISMEGLGL